MHYVRVLERVAELAIFGAAIWPLMRIWANYGFWQKLRVFPEVALAIVSALAAYLLTLAFVWRYIPGALPIAALLVCGAMGYAWRRARPSYGGARGLPPGSLALVPIAPWNDYLFYQKQAERYGPVFKMSNFTTPMVCVVGLKQAKELLRTYDEDLSVPPLPFNRFIPHGFLRYMDAEVHRGYAAIFHAAFSRIVIEECEPYAARAVRHELSTMAKACAKNPAFGAHPEENIRRLLFVVFARMFFGLTPDAGHFERMQVLYQVIDYRNRWRSPDFRVVGALNELVAIVEEIGLKVSGCFLAEALRVKPTVLRDRTFVMNLVYMMSTALIDVAGLIQWVVKKLSEHPEWAARLREKQCEQIGGEKGANGLASRIVKETLRLEQSEYLMRQTRREIRIGDYVIPRGWLLRVCVRESHRSAEAFEDAGVFDPDRFIGMDTARSTYSPFGVSRISCMGEHLTMAVGRIFVTEMARGFDWQVVSDGPRECGSFHWKPSSRFRLTLSSR